MALGSIDNGSCEDAERTTFEPTMNKGVGVAFRQKRTRMKVLQRFSSEQGKNLQLALQIFSMFTGAEQVTRCKRSETGSVATAVKRSDAWCYLRVINRTKQKEHDVVFHAWCSFCGVQTGSYFLGNGKISTCCEMSDNCKMSREYSITFLSVNSVIFNKVFFSPKIRITTPYI